MKTHVALFIQQRKERLITEQQTPFKLVCAIGGWLAYLILIIAGSSFFPSFSMGLIYAIATSATLLSIACVYANIRTGLFLLPLIGIVTFLGCIYSTSPLTALACAVLVMAFMTIDAVAQKTQQPHLHVCGHLIVALAIPPLPIALRCLDVWLLLRPRPVLVLQRP